MYYGIEVAKTAFRAIWTKLGNVCLQTCPLRFPFQGSSESLMRSGNYPPGGSYNGVAKDSIVVLRRTSPCTCDLIGKSNVDTSELIPVTFSKSVTQELVVGASCNLELTILHLIESAQVVESTRVELTPASSSALNRSCVLHEHTLRVRTNWTSLIAQNPGFHRPHRVLAARICMEVWFCGCRRRLQLLS